MNSLKVSIKGSSAPYKFDFQVIEDVESMEFKNFTTLHIQISNIKATIFGGGKEQVVFEFYDPSALTDLNYNPIASSKIMGNLNPYEYITPEEKIAAQSTGQGISYTILTMFSVNLIIKLVVAVSASMLWDLIHVLQTCRYLLMIQIALPGVLQQFMEFLKIVVGEIEEIEDILPNFFTWFILNEDDIGKDQSVFSTFRQNGYDSPFIAVSYGKQLSAM